MSETIYFNGAKYSSPAQMPPNVRRLYEKLNRFMLDENRDGVPDIIQSGGLSGIRESIRMIKEISQISGAEGFESDKISVIRVTDSSIFINGKEYAGEDEIPSSIRREYDRIVRNARDRNEDIYDESWRVVDREKYFDPHDDETFNPTLISESSYSTAPIEPVDSTSRFLLLVGIVIMIFGGGIALWFYFF